MGDPNTAVRAKGLSVNGRHQEETLSVHCWTGIAVPNSLYVELKIKRFNQGANAGGRLSFGLNRKDLRGNPIATNPALAGEIRPSRMRGGLAETMVTVEL
jgi:hypothetical protein